MYNHESVKVQLTEKEKVRVEIKKDNPIKINIEGGVGSDKHYSKEFTSATGGIIVNHDLNKISAITVVDSSKSEVTAEVIHINNNTIELFWEGTFSGTVALN